MPKIIFSEKGFKYDILNHLYFGPDFNFGGTALGRFSQCFLKIFCCQPTMVADILTQLY